MGAQLVEVGERVAVGTSQRREPRRVRWYSVALATTAVSAGVALVAAGAEPPPPGPVLLLSIAVALCINRFAFFTSEQAATAEAAVLLAAAVAFRADAAFLGPLFVALLVGPLDTLHWHQRAYVRMAHNAGNRGLAVLAASAVFAGTSDALGSSPIAASASVVLASAAFALVDLVLSAALLRLQGERTAAAFRHVLDVDVLTLPIACYGAAAGFLAGEVGWWATAVALLPAAFLPELVIARARCRAAVVRDLAVLLTVLVAMVTLAFVVPTPSVALLALFGALGVLAGVELAIDRQTRVAPLFAVVVVVPLIVADGDGVFFAAGAVAVLATTVSWLCTARVARPRLSTAVAVALGAGLLAARVDALDPHELGVVALAACAAGLGFEVVAVLAGSERRSRGLSMLWTAPLLAAAVAWALVWRSLGLGGGALFVGVMSATCAATVWWGTPAWRSRVLRRAVGGMSARHIGTVLGIVAGVAVLTTVVGTAAHDRDLARCLAWISVGLGESAVAMAAMGVRQWRFAPRPRVVGLAGLLLATVVLASAVPALVVDGSAWAAALIIAVMLLVTALARGPADRARAASPNARGVAPR